MELTRLDGLGAPEMLFGAGEEFPWCSPAQGNAFAAQLLLLCVHVCLCLAPEHSPAWAHGPARAAIPAGEAAGAPLQEGSPFWEHSSLLLFVLVILSTGNISRFFWSVAGLFSLSLQSKKIPVFFTIFKTIPGSSYF